MVSTQKGAESANQSRPARRALLTGGAVGVAAVAGATLCGAPSAGAATSDPFVVVPPSGDTSGATDPVNINQALVNLSNAGTGGTVYLQPGDYYINTDIVVPQQVGSLYAGYPCSLVGSRGATVIHQLGSTGIYMHRNHMWGPVQNNQPCPMTESGKLQDFVLDGTGAPAGAIGVDCGDGWGGLVDIQISNFYSSNDTSIGCYIVNRVDWTEKWTFRLHTLNCDQHVVVDTMANVSSEYNQFDLHMYMLGAGSTVSGNGQKGIQWLNGAFLGGGVLKVRGNHGGGGSGNVGFVIMVGGGPNDGNSGHWSQIYNTAIDVTVEGNGTSNNPRLLKLNGSNNSFGGHGLMVAQYGGWQNSQLNGGNFMFSGNIVGDSALSTGWPSTSFPGLGNQWTNNGPDATVCIGGGTLTNIQVNGQNTGLKSGAFYIRAGDTVTVNGTVAPTTWNIVPAN